MRLVNIFIGLVILISCVFANNMILPTDDLATDIESTDIMHRRDLTVWTYDQGGTRLLVMSKAHQTTVNEVGFLILHIELFDALRDTFIVYMNGLYHDERGVKDFQKRGDRGNVTITSPYVPDVPIAIHTWITTD